MNDRSMNSLETGHILNLEHGYLRDRITGEFISRNKILKFLERPGNIKSIEIVCPLRYKRENNSSYTKKILAYLTENLLDISELVLVNGNQEIINELGIADKRTEIRRLQMKGQTHITQSFSNKMSKLIQLICSEKDLVLFKSHQNFQQIFIAHATHDNNSLVAINSLLKLNKNLNKFSIEYSSGQQINLVDKIKEFGGVAALLKRMNYFKVLFEDATLKKHTFGFNKTENLLQTTRIDLVEDYSEHADFESFLNLRILRINTKVDVVDLEGYIGDNIGKVESLYGYIAPTALQTIWSDREYGRIPTRQFQVADDKLIFNAEKQSLKVFAHSSFVFKYIKGDLKSLEISYYIKFDNNAEIPDNDSQPSEPEPDPADECALNILNLQQLTELVVHKSNTLFKQIMKNYKRNVHLLQLQTLRICKEAAKELCSMLHYDSKEFLGNSSLKMIDIWDGIPSKIRYEYLTIKEILSEVIKLTTSLKHKWHFETNVERPNTILGVKRPMIQ